MTASIPRVSVLMPVHNRAPFVERACRSVLAQTFRDFELVIVDDGSRDDSPRRLEALARTDPRIRLSLRENRGLIASRNELLFLARAPLVAWMDSDDISLPERLELQVARFEAEPGLVCLGSAVLEIDGDDDPIYRNIYPSDHEAIRAGLLEGGAMRFPTTMMRRRAALEVGGFREPFKVGEDLDLFLRLMEVGTLANLRSVLLHYRLHPEGISSLLVHGWATYRDTILALAEERRQTGTDRLQRGEPVTLMFRPEERAPPPAAWSNHRQWADQALAGGFLTTARKHALKALLLAPREIACWKTGARVALGTSRLNPFSWRTAKSG
jgi:glycosyltransferase involved in cell wall biosynthesis